LLSYTKTKNIKKIKTNIHMSYHISPNLPLCSFISSPSAPPLPRLHGPRCDILYLVSFVFHYLLTPFSLIAPSLLSSLGFHYFHHLRSLSLPLFSSSSLLTKTKRGETTTTSLRSLHLFFCHLFCYYFISLLVKK